jgi:hypothetical protein
VWLEEMMGVRRGRKSQVDEMRKISERKSMVQREGRESE